MQDIIARFPNAATRHCEKCSDKSGLYNCIAFAIGVRRKWYWPTKAVGHYWPKNLTRVNAIESFTALFFQHGFTFASNAALESGQEKIALYALNGQPKHAALQLPSGLWASKLGPDEDVEHVLEALEGDFYGTVIRVYKRKRA